MNSNHPIPLLETDDRIIAEDIQRLLEDANVYAVLESDNPASSVLNIYSGIRPAEKVRIIINPDDYQMAVEVVENSPYKDLINH